MLIGIGAAALLCGASEKSLRRWEEQGILAPVRTVGNHRRYDPNALLRFMETHSYRPKRRGATGVAAVYCRVSSPKQRDDLDRQKDFLIAEAQKEGSQIAVYRDIGSGLNDKRPSLLRLIRDAMRQKFDKVFLTYLDRLTRFGTHTLLEVFQYLHIEVRAVHVQDEGGEWAVEPQALLVNDMIALVTSFAGKMHRLRRGKNEVAAPPSPEVVET